MPFIYSTLSNPQSVAVYLPYPGAKDGSNKTGSAKPSVRQSVIHIQGGANVIERNLVTPRGVITEVNDDELKALLKQSCFKRWVDRGHIIIEANEYDADDVAADMEAKDGSAQITTADHEERFAEGDTSADVVVDDPKPQRRVRKTRKAPKKSEEKATETKTDEE